MTPPPFQAQLSLFDVPQQNAGRGRASSSTITHTPSDNLSLTSARATHKLSDDDPEKWIYDLHTQIKHTILQYYLKPWARILGKMGRPLAYVDGFAGRGRYTHGEPGSPLLILDLMDSHADHQQQFVCHFVEKNVDNFANMRAEVLAHPAVARGRIQCHFYPCAFSSASEEIISAIRVAGQPSFFFVDPFGYAGDPTMAALGKVLRLPRAEVFVNLMFMFINRALTCGNARLSATLEPVMHLGPWS